MRVESFAMENIDELKKLADKFLSMKKFEEALHCYAETIIR